MAFLGLMTVKAHERILAKADAVIDDAARHLRAEEFSAGRTLGQKVSLALKRLEEARSNAFRNRQMVLTLDVKVAALETELTTLKAERDRRMAPLIAANAARAAASAAKRAGKKEGAHG